MLLFIMPKVGSLDLGLKGLLLEYIFLMAEVGKWDIRYCFKVLL